jgi:NAD(P)-dependent dehydrogenase (short-subunit alcohol dehydrogenase family)
MPRPRPPITSMDDRTVVITGANSGIGLETAAALAGAGARIVMGCRNPTTAAAAVDEIRRRSGNEMVETHSLDLADLEHVRRFAQELSSLDRIDVLINNAGLMLDQRQESVQGHEATFATNHLGPFLLTSLLTEQVVAAPHGRIVNVGSLAHRMAPRGIDWDDIDRRRRYFAWTVYAQSKLANLLHARELARRLWDRGVVAHSLHPGSVASGFGRDGDLHGFNDALLWIAQYVLISPEEGARTSVHLASSPDALRTTGEYWARSRRSTPSRAARDDAAAAELWRRSEQMVAG